MRLDDSGKIVVANIPLEEYLKVLERVRADLDSLSLGPIHPTFKSDLAAFVGFYSTYPRCIEPIRTLVKVPYGHSFGKDYRREEGNVQAGNIRLMYSFVPDNPEEARVQRDFSKGWNTSPKEIEIYTAMHYNPPVPQPEEVVIVTEDGRGLISIDKTLRQSDPEILNAYTRVLQKDLEKILIGLNFPTGTKFDISADWPTLQRQGTFQV